MNQNQFRNEVNVKTGNISFSADENISMSGESTEPFQPMSLAFSFILLSNILLTTTGNTLVIMTIYKTTRFHSPGYYFVASLAVADFYVGLLVAPVSLAYNVTFQMKGKWIFGVAVCDMWIIGNLWFCIASILSLCAVTWDRYVAITSPLHYSMRMRSHRVVRMITAIWLISLVAAIVNCYGMKNIPSRELCEVQGLALEYTLPDFILVYLIPLVMIIFVNVCIAKAVSKQMRRIQQQTVSVMEPSEVIMTASHSNLDGTSNKPKSPGAGTTTERTMKREIKTFRTFLIVTGSFFISWTPFFFVLLVDSFFKVNGTIVYVCVIITYVNSATNPLVYGIFNVDFRRAMIKSLKKCCNINGCTAT